MANPITVPLPADLPVNWTEGQIVAPSGSSVGLSEQHGYNYLMEQVNNAQKAAQELGQEIEDETTAIQNVPSQMGTVIYNGTAQGPTWANYDPSKLTIGGTVTATNYGGYNATFAPKDGYTWADGTTGTKTATWTISKAKINATPVQGGSMFYNGQVQSPSWSGYDPAKLSISGVTTGTNAGTYTAKFTPTSNYTWSDGTSSARNASWIIRRAGAVAVPVQSGALTYTGSSQSPSWDGYDDTFMTLSGQTSGTNVGSYEAVFTLDANHAWEDNTTAPKTVTWTIGRASIDTVPSQSGTLTYNTTEQEPSWENYDTTQLTIGGVTAGTNAGSYTAIFTPTANYQWGDGTTSAVPVTWTIGRATVSAVPTQSGTLTYNASEQSPSWSAYYSNQITLGGVTAATNAGSYTATFTPTANYMWWDSSVGEKPATWSIAKASLPTPSLSPSSVTLGPSALTGTITVSRAGDGVVSAVSSDTTVATVSVSGNTITVSSANDTTGTASITVTIAEGTNYLAYSSSLSASVTATFTTVYGVVWDGSSSTALSRTDASANFVDPVPYVAGATTYGSPFDNLMPWAGMVRVTDAEAGELVAIPKFWYKLTQNGNGVKIQIADGAVDGFSVSPAHMNRGDGSGERDVVYIGRYHCQRSSNYKSVTGVKPRVSITRATARTNIHSLGSAIWQSDFAMRFTIWLLYIVEFADWNSQDKIGYGCGNGKDEQNMGRTDSMPYHTGTTQSSRTTYGLGTQYRYIEGLWDNVYDWMDGCYYASAGLYLILNPAIFSDTANGTLVGKPTSGYPSALTVSGNGGFTIFYPTMPSGSDSTYIPDYWTFTDPYSCLFVGGDYSKLLNLGLFFVNCGNTSYTAVNIGCRLMKLP